MTRLAGLILSSLALNGQLLLHCHAGPPLNERPARPVADALALVQVHGASRPRISSGVIVAPAGPMALTVDGPILGAKEDGYIVFRSVPYAEPPQRFGVAELKRPWEPRLLNATTFGPACIGAATSGVYGEAEDCLALNIWVPEGLHREMPVIVYFHGGLNQHGTGHEDLRHGDLMVQSSRYPTIFINFDFRLGIFGWIYGGEGSGIPNNLGIQDQQLLLKWVRRHIGAFGGDPNRVTLMGQSEGGGILMTHLVSPASAGLFHRCIFISPPADFWSRTANVDRTKFISQRAGCRGKGKRLIKCLQKVPAQKLWGLDWNSEMLARPGEKDFKKNWMSLLKFVVEGKNMKLDESLADLGWHSLVDGGLVPGEPRKLISEGRWNKVPVLITEVKNESYSVLPDSADPEMMVSFLLKKGELEEVTRRYAESLDQAHARPLARRDLMHQMLTDKIWTCDIRSLAKDISSTGGKAYVGMFWHSPRVDPVGAQTSKICLDGAACHAGDMLYLLPQGRGKGIGKRLKKEFEFSQQYSNDILSFVYGQGGTWAPFDASSEAMTFYDRRGPRVVKGYRKEQCQVLDASMNPIFPEEMRRYR